MEKQQPIDPAFVHHTLLAGSGLPQRWQGRQRFVIGAGFVASKHRNR